MNILAARAADSVRTEGAVGLAEGSSAPLHFCDVWSPLSQVVV